MSRHVPWGTVLAILGVDARASSLPARAACPLCAENLLQVYKDLVLGGQWYWCPKCRFAGDAIELAARAWGIGIDSAILKLMALGVCFPADVDAAAIADYVRDHVGMRAKVEALWREASARDDLPGGALGTFARGLGIPAVRPPDWAGRGGQFVGLLDRTQVIRCFQPAQPIDSRRGEQGGHRIFKGKGWESLVVIPHRDLPGRIRGLLLVGREARYPEDFIYRQVFVDSGPAEHGLALLEAILRPHPTFGDAVFACTDAIEAVRLQLAHLVEHGQPLPLVGTWGDVPSQAWDMLPARPTVVFGPEETPRDAARLLRVARTAGRASRVARFPGQRPVDVLKVAGKNAVDWPTRLEEHLDARPGPDAEELFLALGLERANALRFLRDCHPKVRAKLRGIADVDGLTRTVEFGRARVVEEDGLWKDVRTGELISDVIIAVERVVHQKRRGRILLEGTLTRKGVTAPFVADRAALDRSSTAGAWLNKLCLDSGVGLPSVAVYWGRRLMALAQLFRAPVFVEAEGVHGWDEPGNAFVFPRFTLAMGGEIRPGLGGLAPGEVRPGPGFEPPDGLPPETVAALSAEDGSTRLLWATAAAVLAAAVAPCLGLAPPSTALAGLGAVHTLGPLASSLGCPLVDVRHEFAGVGSRLAAMQQYCSWPLAAATADRTADRLAVGLPPGCVCRVGTWAGDVLSLLGGWTVVDAADRGVSALPALRHGSALVTNYLRHFCVDRPHLAGNLVDATLADLAAWFAACGGEACGVRRAAALIRVDDAGRFPARFADLIARLVYEGELVTVRSDLGESASRRPGLAVLGAGLLHVSRTGVARALARQDTPTLDGAFVTRRLAAAGVLVEERDHDGQPGWVVPEPWWTEHYGRWKARHQAFKKVD